MIVIAETTADWITERFALTKESLENALGIWRADRDGKTAFVFGLNRNSMLGLPRLWFIMADGWDRECVRAVREIVQEGVRRYGKLEAFTKPGRDARFAEFAGMRRVGEVDGYVRFETWPIQ